MDPELILVLVTVAGAIAAAILGWAESGEPFNLRKFASSLGRAVIAGLLSSLIFQGVTEITVWTIVLALLTGAGVDVIGHRGAGVLNQMTKKTPTEIEEKPPESPETEMETPT